MVPYPEPYEGNGMFKSFTKVYHSKPYAQISPQRPELSAVGKVVFITGAGTGIGKATAIAFAQAGAKAVAIFGRRIEKLKSAAEEIRNASDGKTLVFHESVDLTQRSAADAAFTSAVKQVGGSKIDIFINNAGTLTAQGTVAGYDEEEFTKAIQMNMSTAFNSIQAALPLLSSNAAVFNISSAIAHILTIPDVWPYAATKAATTKMFDFLQEENPALRVVNIQPGVVDTEINADTDFKGQDEIELPAHFQVWLASPEAEFLKGKFVWVNWDVDELKARAEEIKESLLLKVLLNGVPM